MLRIKFPVRGTRPLGGLRRLTGKPMVWFGRHPIAYAIYVPPALVGMLVPMLLHSGPGSFQLLGSAEAAPPDRRWAAASAPLRLFLSCFR